LREVLNFTMERRNQIIKTGQLTLGQEKSFLQKGHIQLSNSELLAAADPATALPQKCIRPCKRLLSTAGNDVQKKLGEAVGTRHDQIKD